MENDFRTGQKPLLHQVREAVKIANAAPALIMNSRTEYIRPVIQRMAHIDLLDDARDTGARWKII